MLEELQDHLAIQPGNTNQDGGITLEETPCGFLCPVAPAVQVDGIWRGRVTAGDIIQQLQGPPKTSD